MFSRSWLYIALIILGCCMIPAAFAADDGGPASMPAASSAASAPATPQTAPAVVPQLLDEVVKLVAAILAVFAAWAGQRIVRLIEAKAKIDVPAKTEEQIDAWVRQGIAFAESKSLAKLKELKASMRGPEKLEAALSYVLEAMGQYGAFTHGRDILVKKIEALLHVEKTTGLP